MCEVGDRILGHVHEYLVLENYATKYATRNTNENIYPHEKIIVYITRMIWDAVPLRVVGFILDFLFGLAQCPIIGHLYFNVNIPCAFQLDLQTRSRLQGPSLPG